MDSVAIDCAQRKILAVIVRKLITSSAARTQMERFMARDNPTNVDAAFDILLEQIETEIDLVNRAGARAFEGRDYEAARATLEQAGLFIAFRDRTAALRR